MNSEIMIDVRNLHKSFKSPGNMLQMLKGHGKKYVHAIDDVSFVIHKGETLGLVGESGCGKSTLSKILTGLYKPESGKIYFRSLGDITAADRKTLKTIRRQIQMVFQDPYSSLNPAMTVRQMFYEILSVHKICPRKEFEEKTKEILKLAGMPDGILDRYPDAFSGGQRQRLCIARALILKPELLIADEPVSALDMSVQAQILNLFSDLKKKMDLTMLFISHDLRVVQYISDRVMVMYLGHVVEMGDTEEIFQKPGHPYTELLINTAPSIGEEPVIGDNIEYLKETPSPICLPTGCVFHPRCPYAKDVCKRTQPDLKPDPSGRMIRCHFPLSSGKGREMKIG